MVQAVEVHKNADAVGLVGFHQTRKEGAVALFFTGLTSRHIVPLSSKKGSPVLTLPANVYPILNIGFVKLIFTATQTFSGFSRAAAAWRIWG
jgi:hypothetical protein